MLRCDHDETHEKRRCWHLWRGVMCFHMCFWQEQDPNGILAGGIEWHRDERVEPRTFQACDEEAGRNCVHHLIGFLSFYIESS